LACPRNHHKQNSHEATRQKRVDNLAIFDGGRRTLPIKSRRYENLRENLLLDSGGTYLYHDLCGGKAELQKDPQELPDERQEGMQLRQRLRLLKHLGGPASFN
jgi:hypothetical protein